MTIPLPPPIKERGFFVTKIMKGNFIPELPCERLVRKICGPAWRSLPKTEIDAAWGVAIVKSVLDGIQIDDSCLDRSCNLGRLVKYLGVGDEHLIDAYRRLSLNGIFKTGWIENDRKTLESGDLTAWCYYGGYASGAVTR